MKSGIAVDDYKVKKFTTDLGKAGFVFTTGPGVTSNTKLISVIHEESRFKELAKLVKKMEIEFKQSN